MSKLQTTPKICVVGSGIMGLTSAYCLAKTYPTAEIVIYANEFPPNTTSNFGYGIVFCKAYNAKMYSSKIGEWSSETCRHCTEIMATPGIATEMGIKPVEGFLVISKKEMTRMEEDPGQESIAHSQSLQSSCRYFRESTQSEIQQKFLSKSTKFDIMLDLSKQDTLLENLLFYTYGTYIIDTDLYLLWHMKELKNMEKSGQLREFRCVNSTLNHLTDLAQENFDLVVNCSGLGAGKLAGDKLVTPIRAQWTLIRAPDITNLYYGGRTCICPRPGRVALGSVWQWGQTNMDIDPAVTKDNWDRAKSLFPDIQETQILGEYVRLRPGRHGGARLGFEKMTQGSKSISVIHNYGHAGTGIGQHWGCALEVLNIARSVLGERKSKL